MSKTVRATLNIEMNVTCPNDACGSYINLLDEDDTNGDAHNDDSALLRQMFPDYGGHEDFECGDVVCTQCKTKFNVKALEW